MEIETASRGVEASPLLKNNSGRKGTASHPAKVVLLCVYIASVVAAGIFLRNWTWRETDDIHFEGDISNGFFWGEQTLLNGRKLATDNASKDTWAGFFKGYLSVYDGAPARQINGLDYAPLRLLIMSAWVKYEGLPARGEDSSLFVKAAPLLLLNLVCEFSSAVAIFLLVRIWLARSVVSTRPGWLRRLLGDNYILICSLAAASAAWLEPAMILDAHAWPQWDVWIMPFYLFAALAMINNRWMLCGCLIAIAAMIKPQILIVAPFFILVPLWSLQWRQPLRLLAGFGITSALIVLPWLVHGDIGWLGIFEVCMLCAAICVVRKKAQLEGGAWMGIRNVKPAETFFWCCLVFAAGIFLTGWCCGGDFGWFDSALLQGDRTSAQLAEPAVWANLPSLLAKRGWTVGDKALQLDVMGWHAIITLRLALRLAYLAMLILCSFAGARHLRNRDPKLLITLALPWLLMFALMGQMHSRYLMWGAVASSLALGVNIRLGILHFILSAAAAAMILTRLAENRNFTHHPGILEAINTVKPYGACVVLACVAAWLLDCLVHSRRASLAL